MKEKTNAYSNTTNIKAALNQSLQTAAEYQKQYLQLTEKEREYLKTDEDRALSS